MLGVVEDCRNVLHMLLEFMICSCDMNLEKTRLTAHLVLFRSDHKKLNCLKVVSLIGTLQGRYNAVSGVQGS